MPKHAHGVPGFGHTNIYHHTLTSSKCAYMSKRGILGQPRCVLSFRHNFLFGTILGKSGPEDQIVSNRKLCLKLKTHPGWPEIPILLIYAQLGGAKVWCYRFICPKPGTPGAYLGGKRPEKDRNATGSTRPKQEIMSKTQNTPRLARSAPFPHLGALRGCQSVALSVHMPKTRHSGRIFGRETARKRPVTRPDSD